MFAGLLPGWVPPIQAIGLGVDVIGTLVIAAPDIPYINRWFRGGRLREGRAQLETGGLVNGRPGFDEVFELIEDPPGIEVTSVPDVITVEDDRRGPYNWSSIYGHYFPEEGDTMDAERITSIPFHVLQIQIREAIKKSESRIRMTGFILLSLGFSIQIVGVL